MVNLRICVCIWQFPLLLFYPEWYLSTVLILSGVVSVWTSYIYTYMYTSLPILKEDVFISLVIFSVAWTLFWVQVQNWGFWACRMLLVNEIVREEYNWVTGRYLIFLHRLLVLLLLNIYRLEQIWFYFLCIFQTEVDFIIWIKLFKKIISCLFIATWWVLKVDLFKGVLKPFMKSKGPSILPCGTPKLSIAVSDNSTFWSLVFNSIWIIPMAQNILTNCQML